MAPHIQKLPFDIVASSGSDEDHPAEGLMAEYHSTMVSGWQSERFCSWPQGLIVQLQHGNCRIQKIQVLIHNFKIPQRLEFFVGKTVDEESPPDGAAEAAEGQLQNISNTKDKSASSEDNEASLIEFKRLGYVNLVDNAGNSYKVRELKSIHVNVEGTHIKIIVHKCHINALNLYNQV